MNQMRIRMITVPGLAMPYPAGGKQREVQIDLDPSAMQSKACRPPMSAMPSPRRTS
jgi:multidrug efflux pump subunit AcrB